MNVLRVYKCGNTYKYISIPFISNYNYVEKKIKNNVINNVKLDNNIIRAKTLIKDLIMCNNFKFFITITFNSNFDRYDLDSLVRKVTQRIRDARKDWRLPLKYIFIPENHKNGAWHLHGVLDGSFEKYLQYNKYNYLTCILFDDFGFNNISLIQNNDRVGSYIVKYITKDFSKIKRGNHLYYASKGLKRPVLLKTYVYNSVVFDSLFFDYHNEFCSIKYDDELKDLNFLK